MKVLVACEESQRVCIEFRRLGHEAYSCDIEPCSGVHEEWHIQADALPLLDGNCKFWTMDNKLHKINGKWDIIVAFPPCTYLSRAGAVRLFRHDGSIKDEKRYKKGIEAKEFFLKILSADCHKIAVENPVMLKIFNIRKPDQILEPYMFGDPWRKKTCLWLKGLPPLLPTCWVEPEGLWVGSTSANRNAATGYKYQLNSKRNPKIRALTFPGIAKAMAEQWS